MDFKKKQQQQQQQQGNKIKLKKKWNTDETLQN